LRAVATAGPRRGRAPSSPGGRAPEGHPAASLPAPADLVVGKLKRLDPENLADIAFLIERFRLTESDLTEAFERLPARFKADPVVQDNLRYVMEDYL
jgi:hypothetical protein